MVVERPDSRISLDELNTDVCLPYGEHASAGALPAGRHVLGRTFGQGVRSRGRPGGKSNGTDAGLNLDDGGGDNDSGIPCGRRKESGARALYIPSVVSLVASGRGNTLSCGLPSPARVLCFASSQSRDGQAWQRVTLIVYSRTVSAVSLDCHGCRPARRRRG